ncbi:MAG: VOC family protein [Candidatus Binataceae bacterium]
MLKFDHMMLPVSNCKASRDWYVKTLGFKVEFENPKTATIAIRDKAGFTIFLQKTPDQLAGAKCVLTIQVKDVDRKCRKLAGKGVKFINAPQKLMWGYGAELADPDGYQINLWDKVSMRKKGGA